MKFKEIKSLDVIRILENATELFKLGKYRSKKFVETYIGLNISRVGFYGLLQTSDNTVSSLEYTNTQFDSDLDINIFVEGIVVLEEIPVNNGSGVIAYSGYGVLEVDGVVVYDGRLSNAGGGSLVVTHTGDVTGTTVLSIAPDAVSNSQLENMLSGSIKGRLTGGTGDPEDLNPASVRSIINVEDGSTADQTNAEIQTAYNAQVPEATQAEAEAGTSTSTRRFTVERVKQSILALSPFKTNAEVKAGYEANANTNAFTDSEESKLSGIEAGATTDQTDAEIETAYNNQVPLITQAEIEAGTDTNPKRFTAERVKQAITALASGDNMSNANLTFDGTHYVDLNSNEWSIKNGSDSYFNIKSTGEFVIGKLAQNLSTSAQKEWNTIIGYNAQTTAANVRGTVSIGYNATTSNASAVAIGDSSSASGSSSIAILGNATKSHNIAIGDNSQATGNFRATCLGVNTVASYNQTVAIGPTAQATHNFAQAFGTGAIASKTSALAVGYLSKASAIQGIAIGVNTEAVLNHNNSIVIGSGVSNTAGNQLSSTATNQFVVGFASTSPTILIGATTDSYIKSTGTFSLEANTVVKGSDNALGTTGFKVTDVNNNSLVDIRNNGQTCFGGAKVNNVAHIMYNPSGQVSSLLRLMENDGSIGINLATQGRIETNQGGTAVFKTYRQGGVPHLELYHASNGKIVDLQSGACYIAGTSLTVGSTTGVVGAMFTIQNASTNTYQQLFFANVRVVTLGRINSSGSFGADQKGLECYDTDINKKYFWNGTAWEKIKGNIESVSVASATTITPNIDTSEMEIVSALASALTIAVPTGVTSSFYEGKELTFRIKDDGTARGLTWNAIFVDYTGSLPTTTVAGKTVYIGCKYNAVDTKWDVVAVQVQP